MGSYLLGNDPRFYFYPDDAGSNLRTLTWNEPFTVLDPQPVVVADSAAAIGRQLYRTAYGQCFAVRIVCERFQDETDGDRERKLRAMFSHLERGGWVAFSYDHARTWASRASTTPGNGDASIVTPGNLFTGFSASAALGTDDHVILQSPSYTAKWEKCAINGVTTPAGTETLGLSAANVVALDHVADTLVRWEGFFPRLVLPPGGTTQGALTDEYRNTWTLDLTLWTQPDLEHAAIAAGD